MSLKRGREVVELLDSQNDFDVMELLSFGDEPVDLPPPTLHAAVERVRDVFPDADVDGIKRLLLSRSFDETITAMAEEGYEKAKRQTRVHGGKAPSIDFSTPSESWITNDYMAHAVTRLEGMFPYIKIAGIKKLFSENQSMYWRTFEALMRIIGPVLDIPGHSLEPPSLIIVRRSKNALSSCLSKHGLEMKKSIPVSMNFPAIDLGVIEEELEWFKRRKLLEQEETDAKAAHDLNQKMAEDEGNLIECGCCFGDYAFENLVQCSEGHLFCKQCLSRHTEEALYGNGKTALPCMSTIGEACGGFFPDNMLRAALPVKVYTKYAEAQCRDVIKAANLENVVACHHCSLLTQMSPDAGKVLNCPHCNSLTCRDCGEESHIPLRCEEVEKKDQTSLRLKVEEALTKAKVRECPKCKQKFYKSDGCNKMTCPCGANVCYICRANITKEKYGHFCQKPHCTHKTCGGCVLFSDCAADDALAMRDAGLKVINDTTGSISDHKESCTDAIPVNSSDINIDLDKYIDYGALNTKKAPGLVAGYVAPMLNNIQAMVAALPRMQAGRRVVGGGAPVHQVNRAHQQLPRPPPPAAVVQPRPKSAAPAIIPHPGRQGHAAPLQGIPNTANNNAIIQPPNPPGCSPVVDLS